MSDLEQELKSRVDAAEEWRHVEKLSTIVRLAGTPGEQETVDYIMGKLAEYGVPAQLHRFDSFVSHPLEAELEILEPERIIMACRPRAFAASTPPEGIEAEVVFLPSAADKGDKSQMIFSRGEASDVAGFDLAGKIVLTARGGPDGAKLAQEAGAAVLLESWPSGEDVIHEMIVSSIWGTPTPESVQRLVKIPCVSVKKADGEKLKALCEKGTVRARVKAKVSTGWRPVLLPVATVEGTEEPEKFLLVGGHHCSWYYGTTDNATGCATLLEMARVLNGRKDKLRRSVRFAWWPSHSQGRYAGSTWYVDNAFADIRRNCLGYLNIDSPGVRGAEIWDCRYNHGEVERFMDSLMREVTGQEPNIRRAFKAGDQSFFGVGIPSLGAFRMVPAASPDRGIVGGSGGGYWWHSPEDTVDKADASLLAADTEVYLTIAARLATAEKLPFEFVTAARDFSKLSAELIQAAGSHLDLSTVAAAADEFGVAARKLEVARAQISGEAVRTLNDGLMAISRIINPVLYTIVGDFDQDAALQFPLLPGLDPAKKLAGMDPASDAYRFLKTRLVRERNRAEDALRRATLEAERLAAEVA